MLTAILSSLAEIFSGVLRLESMIAAACDGLIKCQLTVADAAAHREIAGRCDRMTRFLASMRPSDIGENSRGNGLLTKRSGIVVV